MGLCLLRVLRCDDVCIRSGHHGVTGHCCWSDWRSRQLLSTGQTETCSRTVMEDRGSSAAGSCGESESTQVSLEPPPWEEFTINEPSFNATRVRPPGSTQTS